MRRPFLQKKDTQSREHMNTCARRVRVCTCALAAASLLALTAAVLTPSPALAETWTPKVANTDAYILSNSGFTTDIHAVDSNTIFILYYSAASSGPRVAKTTNGGTSWATTTVESNASAGGGSLHAVNASTIFVSYFNFRAKDLIFAKSANGGTSWTTQVVDTINPSQTLLGSYGLTSIYAVDANTIFITYYDAINKRLKFAKSTNGGTSWTITIPENPFGPVYTDWGPYSSIHAIDANTVFLVYYYPNSAGTSGVHFAKSTDGGTSWSFPTAVDNHPYCSSTRGSYGVSIYALDANTIFVSYSEAYTSCQVGGFDYSLRMSKSTDSGSSWSKYTVSTGGGGFGSSIRPLDANTIFISHSGYMQTGVFNYLQGVAKTTDGGSTWSNDILESPKQSGDYSSIYNISNNLFLSYYLVDGTSNIKFATATTAAPPPPPTVNLSAAPATIILGGSSTLTWTSTDAASCAAVSPAGWTSSTATSGSETVWPVSTTTYIIQCTGPGGTTQQSATVTVDTTCGEGNLNWTQTYNSGGTQWDMGMDVTVDSGGSIYVAGYQGTNGKDMFLRKYNSAGTFQWAQTYNSGGSQNDYGYGVAVDSGGNIYVTGDQQTNGTDMFLRKYDSTGTFQWMQTYNSGGIQADIGYDVAVDLGGNIYITGYQETNGTDMFLQKYDSSGVLQWTQTYNSGGTQYDQGYGVAVDSGGDIYITGWQATNGDDMFLRKYNSAGTFQWAQTYNSGGTQYDRGEDIAIGSGNIYVTGYQQTNAYDMFLRKYNSGGTFQWMQTYNSGGIQADYGDGVTVDPSGNIYVAGQQGTNGGDMFLQKYDSTGTLKWTQTYNSGGTQGDMGRRIAVDTANNLDIVGYQQTNGYDVVLWQYDGSGCGFSPPPTVTLNANPTTIMSGQSSTLTWTSTDAASCAAVSPAGWTAKTTVNDSELVTNITATTTYIIACTGPGGTAQQSTTVTISGGGPGGGCGVQAYDGTATVTLSCEDPAVSPLRIQKGATTYGIQLVPENDPNASRIRIQTPAGIKALRRQ